MAPSRGWFLGFRFFDICKPLPQLERLPGGWGIMLDDLFAGLLAQVCVRLYSSSWAIEPPMPGAMMIRAFIAITPPTTLQQTMAEVRQVFRASLFPGVGSHQTIYI